MSRPSDELRILRRRQAELAARLDQRRNRRGSRSGAVSFLGQIFNGGHMPTSLPGYFLVHPIANVGGVESEGQSVTTDVNTNALCPIIVVGTKVPAVGDILPVDLISGRWIAERYGTSLITGPGSNCVCIFALPATVRLTVTLSASQPPGGSCEAMNTFPASIGSWNLAGYTDLLDFTTTHQTGFANPAGAWIGRTTFSVSSGGGIASGSHLAISCTGSAMGLVFWLVSADDGSAAPLNQDPYSHGVVTCTDPDHWVVQNICTGFTSNYCGCTFTMSPP